ncbi:hypothetical protein GQ600_2583 [Phytophthora cactorum]|nr:hypothetical protein GQ600_2583 [Phytophthora cactorum]
MCCCFVALTYCRAPCDAVGVSVIDRFTFRRGLSTTHESWRLHPQWDSSRPLQLLRPRMLLSTPDYRTDILGRSIDEVPITDFLGSCWTCIFTSTTKCIRSNPHQLRPPCMEMEDSVGMLDSQRSGTSTLANVHSFGFTNEFFFGVAAAVIGAVFVTTRAI